MKFGAFDLGQGHCRMSGDGRNLMVRFDCGCFDFRKEFFMCAKHLRMFEFGTAMLTVNGRYRRFNSMYDMGEDDGAQ